MIISFLSCLQNDKNNSANDTDETEKEEILIYCENSMVPVLMELKNSFESKMDCRITLRNDCSQNLVSLIQYSHKGDIFIPGSKDGFLKFGINKGAFLVDSVFLGYNSLVVISGKGNPSKYSGYLTSLKENKHAIIMANPETSSLGAETRRILKRYNVYDEVVANVIALTTDSRGLIKSIENGEAELVIDWRSDLYYNGNSNNVEVFKINDESSNIAEIYGGILSTSENKNLAKEFLDYVSGDNGLIVFKKYGFTRRKPLIF